MKTNLRKLNLLSRFIDFSMFYAIDLNRTGYIRLQGLATDENVRRLNRLFDLKFKPEFNWFEGHRNSINVTLTLPHNAFLKTF